MAEEDFVELCFVIRAVNRFDSSAAQEWFLHLSMTLGGLCVVTYPAYPAGVSVRTSSSHWNVVSSS